MYGSTHLKRVQNVSQEFQKGGLSKPESIIIFPNSHYYQALHMIDPIFGLSGNDPKALSGALSLLNNAREYVESIEKQKTKDELFPEQFLETLPPLIQAERDLERVAQPVHVFIHIMRLTRSLQALEKELATLQKELKKFPQNTRMVFFGGEAYVYDLQSQILQARDHIDNAQKKQKRRVSCFLGIPKSCSSIADDLDSLEIKLGKVLQEQTATNKQTISVSDPDLKHSLYLYNEVLNADFPMKQDGNFLVRVESSTCTLQFKDAYYAFSLLPSPGSGGYGLRTNAISELFFLDLTHTQPQYAPVRRSVDDALYIQWVGAPYICADAGIDYGSVNAVRKIQAERREETAPPYISYRATREDILEQVRSEREAGLLTNETLYLARLIRERTASFDEVIRLLAGIGYATGPVVSNVDITSLELNLLRFSLPTLFLFGNESLYESPITMFTTNSTEVLEEQIKFYTLNEGFLIYDNEQIEAVVRKIREQFLVPFYEGLLHFPDVSGVTPSK